MERVSNILLILAFGFFSVSKAMEVTQDIAQDAVAYKVIYKLKIQDNSKYKEIENYGSLRLCEKQFDESDRSKFEWRCSIDITLTEAYNVQLVPILASEYVVKIYKGQHKKGDEDADFIYVRKDEWDNHWHNDRKRVGAVWTMLPPDTPDNICSMRLAWERWQKAVWKKNTKSKCSKEALKTQGHKCNFDHEYVNKVQRNAVCFYGRLAITVCSSQCGLTTSLTANPGKSEYQRREAYCSPEKGVCGATIELYAKHGQTSAGNWFYHYIDEATWANVKKGKSDFKPTGCFVWSVDYGKKDK